MILNFACHGKGNEIYNDVVIVLSSYDAMLCGLLIFYESVNVDVFADDDNNDDE